MLTLGGTRWRIHGNCVLFLQLFCKSKTYFQEKNLMPSKKEYTISCSHQECTFSHVTSNTRLNSDRYQKHCFNFNEHIIFNYIWISYMGDLFKSFAPFFHLVLHFSLLIYNSLCLLRREAFVWCIINIFPSTAFFLYFGCFGQNIGF